MMCLICARAVVRSVGASATAAVTLDAVALAVGAGMLVELSTVGTLLVDRYLLALDVLVFPMGAKQEAYKLNTIIRLVYRNNLFIISPCNL